MFKSRRAAAALVALLVLGFAVVFMTPASAERPAGSSSDGARRQVYWGAWVGTQWTGTEAPWSWNAVTQFEQRNSAGKHISLIHWSSPFSSSLCGGTCTFRTSVFESVRRHGAISFFSWAWPAGSADRDVAAGRYDAYITSWARAARSWGKPFFLRLAWEMNGPWFSWGVGNNGNTAADYVAMWRHVHDIFMRVGATNVTWVWCPNIDPGGRFAGLPELYPGDAYVDWTCLDGYNGNTPWMSFTDLFGSTYDLITRRIAPTKPMIIGEVGSTESGGSKAQWISNMFAVLPTRFPRVRGLLWMDKFEVGVGGYPDWPVETSPASSVAFASGIGSPTFATNRFARLCLSPIPPPSSTVLRACTRRQPLRITPSFPR